jgi:uncharacterized protein (TIGR03083 family)
MTTLLTASRTPRRPALDRPTAMRLAADEYLRYLQVLRGLSADDWTRPTDCPAWDVRAMAGHNLGMAEMVASIREGVRQQVKASRRPGIPIDALTGLQVEERAHLTTQELIARYATAGPKAARGRKRVPAFLRNRTIPEPQVIDGEEERWVFGFLFDTILTRDTWMHRIDTSRAIGADLVLTAQHDGVIVADVVREWAERHGSPCRLHLSGPAGDTWTFGSGGPELELDAIEFCRIVSGRGTGDGLLGRHVPF